MRSVRGPADGIDAGLAETASWLLSTMELERSTIADGSLNGDFSQEHSLVTQCIRPEPRPPDPSPGS